MDLVALALGIVKLISQWMASRAATQAAEAEDARIIAQALTGALAEIDRARKARQGARDAARRDPAGVLHDDDGFGRE